MFRRRKAHVPLRRKFCDRDLTLLPSSEKAKRGRFAYTALPAAHFDRNERYAYFGDRTLG